MGRLSPIPSLLGVDSDWTFGTNLNDFNVQDAGVQSVPTPQEQAALDQLADQLAGSDLTLTNEFLQGSVFIFIFMIFIIIFIHAYLFICFVECSVV